MLKKSGTGGLGNSSSKGADSVDSKWRKLSLAVNDLSADAWFAELGITPVREVEANALAAMGDFSDFSALLKDDRDGVVRGMQCPPHSFGSDEIISQSELGKAVMAFLDSKGVEYHFNKLWALSHSQQVELDIETLLIGQWGTDLKTPFLQRFQIFRDEQGVETGFWHVQLLASPVSIEEENRMVFEFDGEETQFGVSEKTLSEGGFTLGEFSTRIHLPVFLKKLAFMSETPYPSTTIMSFSRDIAYPEIPLEARPIPTFQIFKHESCSGYSPSLKMTSGQVGYNGTIAPSLVTFGWRFGKETIPYLDKALSTVIDGCTYAMSTVEDGYLNYRDSEYPANWDDTLANPCSKNHNYVHGESRLGWGQWIPMTQFGELITKSDETLREAYEIRDRYPDRAYDKIRTVLDDGVGWSLASAINTWAFSYILPSLREDPDLIFELEHQLKLATALEVAHESTNAISNLGIGYLLLGQEEDAIQKFKEALERDDKAAESEASKFLSIIYEDRGDTKLAHTYRQRSEAAGEYVIPEWFLENEGSQPDYAEKKFCSSCGTKFADADQKFCVNCGERR